MKTNFETSWNEYVKYRKGSDMNDIDIFWEEIFFIMPEELKSKLPNMEPSLEVFGKKQKKRNFSIPYVFRIPNICNCNGINEFLENYIINIVW